MAAVILVGRNLTSKLHYGTRLLSSIMVKAKKFVFKKPFDGMPKESDFDLVEEELPPIKDGEYLSRAEFLSVDPYMRAYAPTYKPGMTMIGGQVARIIESKNSNFPVGSLVVGNFGWRTHTISNPKDNQATPAMAAYVVPELNEHPSSLYLGILGMPGNTAYFGFNECCQPKNGETVVVTGAGGAVGSHVGQLAKINGCRAIGIVGSEEKGQWIKSIGFDDYINYKTEDIRKALNELAPKGVDCYFDNVGGEISSTIIQQMNMNGRVGVCGSISAYNEDPKNIPKATILQPSIVMKCLTIKGLYATKYADRWLKGILQNKEYLEAGKLKYKETVYEGFENTPKALIGVLKGENIGKAVVKA